MSQEVIRARDRVHTLKVESSLLGAMDRYHPNNLPVFAAAEVDELQAEVEHADDSLDIAKVADENADIWVLLLSYLLVAQPEYNLTSNLYGVNGEGKRSDIFDRLKMTLLEITDDPQAVRQALRLLYSLSAHLPVPLVGLQRFHLTINKVSANRPSELYSNLDANGVPLTADDVRAKYKHLERMTKYLRSVVGRTLQPADWQPYTALFLDFRNSDMAFSIFRMLVTEKNASPSPGLSPEIVVFSSQTLK